MSTSSVRAKCLCTMVMIVVGAVVRLMRTTLRMPSGFVRRLQGGKLMCALVSSPIKWGRTET